MANGECLEPDDFDDGLLDVDDVRHAQDDGLSR